MRRSDRLTVRTVRTRNNMELTVLGGMALVAFDRNSFIADEMKTRAFMLVGVVPECKTVNHTGRVSDANPGTEDGATTAEDSSCVLAIVFSAERVVSPHLSVPSSPPRASFRDPLADGFGKVPTNLLRHYYDI
jgi:hypothetical protein